MFMNGGGAPSGKELHCHIPTVVEKRSRPMYLNTSTQMVPVTVLCYKKEKIASPYMLHYITKLCFIVPLVSFDHVPWL